MTDADSVAPAFERASLPPLILRLAEVGTWTGSRERRARDWDQLQDDLESMSDELVRDLTKITAEDGSTQSLCKDWSVRDVLAHLVSGDLRATEALTTTFGQSAVTLGVVARNLVAAEVRDPLGSLLRRFGEVRRRLLTVAANLPPTAVSVYVPWVAGEISVFALVQSRVMETWIHGWDMRWPLKIAQPFDDRCWWLADIGVRHVPYALRLANAGSDSCNLHVRLDGVAGGSWNRMIGLPPARPVSISGPAWAWVTWASRRVPAQASAKHLSYASDDLASLVVETARSFA